MVLDFMFLSGVAITALAGGVTLSTAHTFSSKDYNIALPPVPLATSCLRYVMSHSYLKMWPYCVEDFRQELERRAVLSGVLYLGAYKMNDTWLLRLRMPETKERLVDSRELSVKNLACVVIDPGSTHVRLWVQRVPIHVNDDAMSNIFERYEKVAEVTRELLSVEWYEVIKLTTHIV
uniref:Secreted protein n=1 Tax=Ixodes ricinus TaxID=34613 RepID=A0A147BCW2_IXORI